MLEEVTPGDIHPQPRVTALLSVAENLAPVSWHMPISKEPFVYGVAMRPQNYSHTLIKQHGEFALNFLDYAHFELTDELGSVHGDEIQKFAMSALHRKTASKIAASLVEEAYMIYECKVIDVQSYGDHDIFIGEVVALHADKSVAPNPTLFLGRGEYATVCEKQRVARG